MKIDYSQIDQPFFLQFIFYPREDFTPCPENAFDLMIMVEDKISVSSRFYIGHLQWPWILFFHGNGEVVSDYDGIAPLYHKIGLNLVVADYRGYGSSNGVPTLTHLAQDCHLIFKGVKEEISRRNLRGDLLVMGRSLGSISAIELAYHHQDSIKGLIIESGFPSVVRLIYHFGIPAFGIDLKRIDQSCMEMIQGISLPSLIIHGEEDQLVPLENAEELYHHLGTNEKELLIIPGATHNDIMVVGFNIYFETMKRFMMKIVKGSSTN